MTDGDGIDDGSTDAAPAGIPDDPVDTVRARVPDDLRVPESARGRQIVHDPTGTELVSIRRFEPTRRIDGDSAFANPFERTSVPGDGGDGAALGLYEGWFRGQLLEDEAFAAAVSDLSGERLGCHCLPRPCHGEVILAHLAAAHDG